MITAIFITSLFCVGLHGITRRGKIFGFVSFVLADKETSFPVDIAQALTECLTCMASFWGIAGYAYFFSPIDLMFVPMMLLTIFVLWVFSFFNRTLDYWEIYLPNKAIYLFLAGGHIFLFMLESIPFILALAGMNYLFAQLIHYLNFSKNYQQSRLDNSIDQQTALQHLLNAISNPDKKDA